MARPQKNTEDKLTVILPVRLSPSDKARYKKLAFDKGQSVSEYIRQLVEQDAASPSVPTTKVVNDNQPINQFDEKLLHELFRIGNNLNQLTKKFHSKDIEPKGLRSLFPVLEKLLTHVFKRVNIE